jgi:hypothetical protein
VDTDDRGRDLLEYLRASEPCSVKDRASFVERMATLYDASFPLIDGEPKLERTVPVTPASTPENP